MKAKLILNGLFILIVIAIITGCPATGSYTSKATYNRAIYGRIATKSANYEGIKRNPVIVIPGFLGSKLISAKTKKNIWGNFTEMNAIRISDEQMREITYPMEYGKPLRALKDDVIASKIMESAKIRIFGVSLELTAYNDLINFLVKGGYQPENRPLPKDKHFFSLFMFAYDWRRDLPETASRLHQFILKKRRYLQKKYEQLYGIKDYDVQFDIIAHSMGGLITRYYLRYGDQDLPKDGSMPKLNWSGSNFVDRAIIVGTPNAGYLDTFLEILKGGKDQPYPPAALGTIPTYYQMLPVSQTSSIVYADNNETIDIFDPNVWLKNKWCLADPKQDSALQIILPKIKTQKERKRIAIDHLSKCLKRAKQFIKAMKIKSSPPEDVRLYLVLGNAVKTSRRAFIDRKNGKVKEIKYAPGDGKVLVTSALFDERAGQKWTNFLRTPIKWEDITLVRAAHMGITKAPSFEDNVLFLLIMEETVKQKNDLKAIKKAD